MTKPTFLKPLFYISFLLFATFYACQKDNLTDANLGKTMALKMEDAPLDGIVEIKDEMLPMPDKNALRVRAEEAVGDIEDVIAPPAGSAPATDSCNKLCPTFPGVTHCEYLCHLIRLSKPWEIKPGQRFGVKKAENVCEVPTLGSAFSCYDTDTQQFCGYDGKEKAFPLTINNDGNYRIQVTPTSRTKDFDVFIYKKSSAGTQGQTSDDKELVACSRHSAGRTETINLTQKGRYHILVDEYSNRDDCQNGEFIVAVSANTNIVVEPTQKGHRLYYEFKVLKVPASSKLVGWAFRLKNTEGVLSDPIRYPAHCRFVFASSKYDYLVSPVYWNATTQETVEGAATLFRP